VPANTAFSRDPVIKRECVWTGPLLRPSAVLCDRLSGYVRVRDDNDAGGDLAAALQTIREIGDPAGLDSAVAAPFPGSSLAIAQSDDGRLSVQFHQHGLLRPLGAAELSDCTLRYLLWIAALLSPRPAGLLVLNEPETSLHPDLLPALGRLIAAAGLGGGPLLPRLLSPSSTPLGPHRSDLG
jgi:hypothetical protein